jgi:hypothetical protein
MDTMAYDLNDQLFLWSPGLLNLYLKKLKLIVSSKKIPETDTRERSVTDDEKGLQDIKTETLYIPEYCLLDYNKITHTYKDAPKDKDKVFEKYTYTYEVLTDEDLNALMLDDSKEVYILIYTVDNPRKYINILNTKTGKIVYVDFSTPAYEFGKGDVKTLMKALGE